MLWKWANFHLVGFIIGHYTLLPKVPRDYMGFAMNHASNHRCEGIVLPPGCEASLMASAFSDKGIR